MAEKFGHIELVSATISLLQNGSEPDNAQPKDSLLTGLNGSNGSSALVANALGAPWQVPPAPLRLPQDWERGGFFVAPASKVG